MHSDGEPGDQEEPEPVGGHRIEEEGSTRGHVVERLVTTNSLGDPEGDGDSEGEGEGDTDEDQVVRQLVGHERIDALVQPVGVAQVAVQDVGEKRQVLQLDRAVEPVRPLEGGDRSRARPWPEDGSGEVARNDVLEHEHEQRQADKDDHGLDKSPQCEPDHAWSGPPSSRPLRQALVKYHSSGLMNP